MSGASMAKMTHAELLRLRRADADAIAGMDDRARLAVDTVPDSGSQATRSPVTL
jgi:hypothetical protein